MIRLRRSLCLLVLLTVVSEGLAFAESQLRFCLRSEPKSFNPLLVENDSEETIRYLTGGVLVRVNRQTQNLDPELALSWKVSKDGRQISFKLRNGLLFSDGTPFSAADVEANSVFMTKSFWDKTNYFFHQGFASILT